MVKNRFKSVPENRKRIVTTSGIGLLFINLNAKGNRIMV